MRRRGRGSVSGKRRSVRRGGPPTDRDREMAARKLQGMYRARCARRRMRLLIRSVYEKVYDPETGAYFFHNLHTGDTSWEAPKLLGKEDFDTVADDTVSPHDAVEAYRSLAKHWEAFLDPDSNQHYYYNHASGETTWSKPEVLVKLEQAVEERDEMLGDDWEEVQDMDLGGFFFHNKKTGETQWEPPRVDFRKTKEEKEREAREALKLQKKLEKEAARNKRKGETEENPDKEDQQNQSFSDSGSRRSSCSSSDSSDDSDSDDEPPDAIEVKDDEDNDDVFNPTMERDFSSSDSNSVYVSSSEQEFDENDKEEEGSIQTGEEPSVGTDGEEETPKKKKSTKRRMGKRERKKLEKRKARHSRQKANHLKMLEQLRTAPESERKAYEARLRMKRCRKRSNCDRLDISNMQLKTFPDEITRKLSKRVKSINLGFNFVEEIPPEIKKFRRTLEKLQMDSNQLVRLPVELWYCTTLEELDFRNNRIVELPRERGNMQVLREMNVWEIGIETLKNLKSLRLDRNQISVIPDHIGSLSSLEVLTARCNRIVTLPESSLGELRNLVRLDLSENGLTGLPQQSLGKMTNLQVLSIASNQIGELPLDFGEMKSLRVFDGSKNRLARLPDSFMSLDKLQILKLERNQLEFLCLDWASALGKSLRMVDLSYNLLSKIPDSFAHASKLEHLNLSHNRLKPRLPREIARLMTNLRTLDASHNLLEDIGFDVFTNLQNLVRFNLEHNNIRKIHADMLFKMPKLTELNLSHNMIDALPPPSSSINDENDHGPRKTLRILNVANNEIPAFPVELFTLQNGIETLICSANRFTKVPEEIGILNASLKHLELDNCRLTELPGIMSKLRELRFLSACGNQFTERPKMLETLPKLKHWKLDFNPILYPRQRKAEIRTTINEADILAQRNKREEAIAAYTEILERMLLQKDDEHFEVEVKSKRGACLVAIEKYRQGVADLTYALARLDKTDPKLLYLRAVARFRGLGDPTGSLNDLDQAIKLKPDYPPSYVARSNCLIHLGHYNKALQDADMALDRNMFDPNSHMCKGLALENLLKLDEALASYREVIRLCSEQETTAPSSWSPIGTAYYRSGIILRQIGKHPEAVAQFQTASDLLHTQSEKAQPGSKRKRKLQEQLRLAIICRSSSLCSMNRTKKGSKAYEEAIELTKRMTIN